MTTRNTAAYGVKNGNSEKNSQGFTEHDTQTKLFDHLISSPFRTKRDISSLSTSFSRQPVPALGVWDG